MNRFRRPRKPGPLWADWYPSHDEQRQQKQRQSQPERGQVRGWATITFPHFRHRFPVRAARDESSFGVKGNRPALIRGPSKASTAGTSVFVSNTLIAATTNPATPIERISLMGTVSRARNPMATVEAEIKERTTCLTCRYDREQWGPLCPAEIASRNRLTMRSA